MMFRPSFLYQAPAGDQGSVIDRGDEVATADPEPKPVVKVVAPVVVLDEEETVETTEDGAEATEKAEEGAKSRDSRIPLARHKEILAKERAERATERAQRTALEERLAQFEKGTQVAALNQDLTQVEDSVLKMEKEYTQFLADGEIDKATALMAKIRQAERQIVETKNDFKLQASIAQATEQARYNVALERVEEAYAVLNPDSDDFDKEILGEVVEMKIFYETMRKMTPTAALQAAVKKIVGQDTKTQEKAVTVAPRVSEKDIAAERKAAAVGKTLDVTARTPPSTAKVGLDSDKAGVLTPASIMKMSQKEFKALPDDVLAKMRGDEL